MQEETTLLSSGCICCNKKQGLIHALQRLLDRGYDYILIETTGLASPAPILFGILSDSLLGNHLYITHIITYIDCINVHLHIQDAVAQA